MFSVVETENLRNLLFLKKEILAKGFREQVQGWYNCDYSRDYTVVNGV